MENEEEIEYTEIIYDRFCDDIRCFDYIKHDGKVIKNCTLDYNEDMQCWEFEVLYKDGSNEIVKDKLIQFICECVYYTE